MNPAATKRASQLGGVWPFVLGFAALAIPTGITLADQTWSKEVGAHGPIVLATGGWLLWRQLPEMRRLAAPGSILLTTTGLALGIAAYVFGRAYDFITLEAGGLYVVGLSMLHAKFGSRAVLASWFPLFYLAFAVPPPGILIDNVTAPLKHFVSFAATASLHLFGLPVSREGVTIFIAQYQLLVEDACSGMNSLIGLTAISLLYIYLTRGSSWRYSLLLTTFVIPIAVVANILRIIILILLTYGYGDEVAQSFLHFTAGLFLFAASLVLVFALDRLLGVFWHRMRRPA